MMSCFLGAGGEVDHPSYYALLSLARPFVSGRAVSEAEMTGLIAALDPEKLKADAVRYYAIKTREAAEESSVS